MCASKPCKSYFMPTFPSLGQGIRCRGAWGVDTDFSKIEIKIFHSTEMQTWSYNSFKPFAWKQTWRIRAFPHSYPHYAISQEIFIQHGNSGELPWMWASPTVLTVDEGKGRSDESGEAQEGNTVLLKAYICFSEFYSRQDILSKWHQ